MADEIVRKGHPILAFFLGLLLGIILVVGAIAGGVYFGLTYKLDKIGANKDKDGNYIYINADPSSGGAENLLGLVQKVMEIAGDSSSLTIGAIENLLPVASSLTGSIIAAAGEYVELDETELKNTPFSDLGNYLQEAVMDVRPANLIEKFGGSLADNRLLQIFLNGPEADYVEYGNTKYPVFYDNYVLNGSVYIREGDRATLRPVHEEFLQEGNKLYFFDHGDNFFVTYPTEDGYAFTEGDDMLYSNYNSSFSKLTGSYYYSGTSKIEITPVTIRSLTDGSAIEALDNLKVTELLNGETEGEYSNLTDKVLGDITVGALVSGEVNFDEIIHGLEIAELVDVDPTNTILVYLGYGVTGAFRASDGGYRGTYKLTEENYVNCHLITEEGEKGLKVTGAYYFDKDGERVEIPATKVGEVESKVQNITSELALSDLLFIDAPTQTNNNSVMIFFAFSVTDVKAAEAGLDYSYTGVYHPFGDGEPVPCYITVQDHDGKDVIADIYVKNEQGEDVSVERTKIVGVSEQITRLTKTLRIRDLITVDPDNKIMVKLGDYAIDEVGNAARDLSLDDFIDVTVGNNSASIISYIVYGVTDVYEQSGSALINGAAIDYTHLGVYTPVGGGEKQQAFVRVENGKITEVYTAELGKIHGTKVNEVNDRVNGVTRDITIGQLVNVNGNKMLEAISGSTIESLPQDIANLSINELYAEEVYGGAQRYKAEEFNEKFVYYTQDSEGKYTLVNAGGENAGKLTAEEFANGEYYTYGAPTALWKLLIYINGSEKVYSVNNISQMIENVTLNVQNTSLRELHEAKVLEFSNEEQLDKTLNGKQVGEYNLGEFVFFIVNNIDKISLVLGQNPPIGN